MTSSTKQFSCEQILFILAFCSCWNHLGLLFLLELFCFSPFEFERHQKDSSIKEIKTSISEKILLSELKNADGIFKKYNLYLESRFLFLKPQGVIVSYNEIETIKCYDKVIMKIPMAAYNYLITMYTKSGRKIVFGNISSEIKPKRNFKMAVIVKAEIQKHIETPKTIG